MKVLQSIGYFAADEFRSRLGESFQCYSDATCCSVSWAGWFGSRVAYLFGSTEKKYEMQVECSDKQVIRASIEVAKQIEALYEIEVSVRINAYLAGNLEAEAILAENMPA